MKILNQRHSDEWAKRKLRELYGIQSPSANEIAQIKKNYTADIRIDNANIAKSYRERNGVSTYKFSISIKRKSYPQLDDTYDLTDKQDEI